MFGTAKSNDPGAGIQASRHGNRTRGLHLPMNSFPKCWSTRELGASTSRAEAETNIKHQYHRVGDHDQHSEISEWSLPIKKFRQATFSISGMGRQALLLICPRKPTVRIWRLTTFPTPQSAAGWNPISLLVFIVITKTLRVTDCV